MSLAQGNNASMSNLGHDGGEILEIVSRLEEQVKLLKQDSRSQPAWLKIVMDKLNTVDRLESKFNNSLDVHSVNVDVSDWNKVGIASTVTRMREEINNSASTTRIEFEARMEELRLCLDRTEKMISSRPKMNEFQQIQTDIEESNTTMKASVVSSITRIERSVNSRIATEFEDLSSWKRQNERLTQERFDTTNKEVHSLSSEMAGLRDAIMNLKCDLGLKLNNVQSQMEIKLSQLVDNVTQLTQDQSIQEKRLSDVEDKSSELNVKIEELFSTVYEVKNLVEQKFGDVDRLLGDQMSSSGNLSQSISDIQNVVNINLLPKIDKLEEKLQIDERQIMDQRYQIQNHTTLLKKTESTLIALDQMDSVTVLTRVKEGWEEMRSKLDKTNLSALDSESLISVLSEKSTAASLVLSTLQQQVQDSGTFLTSTDKQCSSNCESIRQLDSRTSQAFDVLKSYGEQVSQVPDLVRHADEISNAFERMQLDIAQAREKHEKEVGKLSQVSTLVDKLKKDTTDTIKTLSVSIQNQADAAQASTLAMLGPSLDERIQQCVNKIMFGDDSSPTEKDDKNAGSNPSSSSSTTSTARTKTSKSKSGAAGGFFSKSAKKNPLDMSEEERMTAINDFADSLAEICIGYEKFCISLLSESSGSTSADQISGKRKQTTVSGSWPPPVPPNLLQELALIAGDSAEFLSKCADGNAIIKSVSIQDMVFPSSTALGTAIGDSLSEDLANQERLALTSTTRNLIANTVEQLCPVLSGIPNSTTSTRRECRVSFLSKISNVIDMSLSKYDSVVVTNHSRFGRMKIPTCIACDRPLIGRLRPRPTANMNSVDNLPLVDDDKMNETGYDANNNAINQSQLMQSASSSGILNGSKASKSKGKKSKNKKYPSSEASIFTELTASMTTELLSDARLNAVDDLTLTSKEPQAQTFVYRGGFKMPRRHEGSAGKAAQQENPGAFMINPTEMTSYSIPPLELPSLTDPSVN